MHGVLVVWLWWWLGFLFRHASCCPALLGCSYGVSFVLVRCWWRGAWVLPWHWVCGAAVVTSLQRYCRPRRLRKYFHQSKHHRRCQWCWCSSFGSVHHVGRCPHRRRQDRHCPLCLLRQMRSLSRVLPAARRAYWWLGWWTHPAHCLSPRCLVSCWL